MVKRSKRRYVGESLAAATLQRLELAKLNEADASQIHNRYLGPMTGIPQEAQSQNFVYPNSFALHIHMYARKIKHVHAFTMYMVFAVDIIDMHQRSFYDNHHH